MFHPLPSGTTFDTASLMGVQQCITEHFNPNRSANALATPATTTPSPTGGGLVLDETAAMALRSVSALAAGEAESGRSSSGGKFCPVIFDSWKCWPATRAGEVATGACPDFPHLGFSPSSESVS